MKNHRTIGTSFAKDLLKTQSWDALLMYVSSHRLKSKFIQIFLLVNFIFSLFVKADPNAKEARLSNGLVRGRNDFKFIPR